jgi:hypothetical protein
MHEVVVLREAERGLGIAAGEREKRTSASRVGIALRMVLSGATAV